MDFSNYDSGAGQSKVYPIQEQKPARSEDPYANTVLNPDFVPTRSDLMGNTAADFSPQ